MKNYQRGFSLDAVWFLIIASVILFIATSMNHDLQINLGLQRSRLSEEPWIIVTNLFIHADIWHILTNMVTFYFFGTYLYNLVGEARFLIIYFLGGIVGNIFFLVLGNQYNVAIGASGAIFAIGGALTVMLPNLKVIVFPIPVPVPLWIAIFGGFVIVALFPHVAWQAHLGGLLFGLLAGYLFKKKYPPHFLI